VDPRALEGAHAIAICAAAAATSRGDGHIAALLPAIEAAVADRELLDAIYLAARFAESGAPPHELAAAMGLRCGVSGFVNHTVPVAIHCWLTHRDDFAGGVEGAVRLGGDTDTTGAIVGALVGAAAGPGAIPQAWLDGLIEWPRTVAWMRELACRLDEGRGPAPLRVAGVPARNLAFLAVVLAHGLRRLAPL
jgi:ADP-ribosylglycohydrolase